MSKNKNKIKKKKVPPNMMFRLKGGASTVNGDTVLFFSKEHILKMEDAIDKDLKENIGLMEFFDMMKQQIVASSAQIKQDTDIHAI